MSNPIPEWSDAFGQQVSHGISNSVDIPSFYSFNPERLRYFKNGSRIRVQDIPSESTFTDRQQDYLLEPAQGDDLVLRSSERPRYVVGVDVAGTLESHIPTGLGVGDQWKFGLTDGQSPENAAYFEVNGGSPNRLVIIKGGSEEVTDTFSFPAGTDETTPIRWEIRYNWYGAGPFTFRAYYTDESAADDERSVLKTLGQLSLGDARPTNDANFHVFQEIDAATSGLQVSAGSFGFLTFGDVSPTSRTKGARLLGLSYGGSGEYEPLAAVRIDPARGNVFTQMVGIECVPNSGDGELLAIVVPAGETDASGFSTPPQHSPTNSVIEQTTSITQFPNQAGSLVTSAADPDGYQVGFFASDAPSTGPAKASNITGSREVRPIYEDDTVVFLYKADSATSTTVNLVYNTKQLW